jgi:hypothetical protein
LHRVWVVPSPCFQQSLAAINPREWNFKAL